MDFTLTIQYRKQHKIKCSETVCQKVSSILLCERANIIQIQGQRGVGKVVNGNRKSQIGKTITHYRNVTRKVNVI